MSGATRATRECDTCGNRFEASGRARTCRTCTEALRSAPRPQVRYRSRAYIEANTERREREERTAALRRAHEHAIGCAEHWRSLLAIESSALARLHLLDLIAGWESRAASIAAEIEAEINR